MNSNKIKVMSQGAMLASIFGVLGIFNMYTASMFDIVLAYVMTIGLTYYTYLNDYKAGLSVLAASFVVLFLVGDLFFTLYVCFTLFMGVYYGYCLKCQKSKRVTRYGLILISAAKNILIFFVLGSMLGINVYQEGLEIYQWITSFIPFYQSLISPEISFILLWLLVFVSEAYIVIIYSGFIISKLMKRK